MPQKVFKKKTDSKEKYKLTKALGIKYTKQLLKNSPEWLEHLAKYKKQDDLCDAYLQGRYYLEFIRHKPAENLNLMENQSDNTTSQDTTSDTVSDTDKPIKKNTSDKKPKKNANGKSAKKSKSKSKNKTTKKTIVLG